MKKPKPSVNASQKRGHFNVSLLLYRTEQTLGTLVTLFLPPNFEPYHDALPAAGISIRVPTEDTL
jgi:hypothetical protein